MADLVQWVARGLALAALVSLVLAFAPRLSATVRYRVWWLTLVLVLALPVLGRFPLPLPSLQSTAFAWPVSGATPAAPLASVAAAAAVLWTLVGVWRIRAGLGRLRRAKRTSRPLPVLRERQLVRWLGLRNRGRRATLGVSDFVPTAGVAGLGYPHILVNAVVFPRLGDEELDQVVLHEYAHVQRRDDVSTLVRASVMAVVGWHPAVAWIDRQLALEGEAACDDWVVGVTGAPRTYARCLTRLAEHATGRPALLVPALGGRGRLQARLARLHDSRRDRSTRVPAARLVVPGLLVSAAALGLSSRQAAFPPDTAAPAPPPALLSPAAAPVPDDAPAPSPEPTAVAAEVPSAEPGPPAAAPVSRLSAHTAPMRLAALVTPVRPRALPASLPPPRPAVFHDAAPADPDVPARADDRLADQAEQPRDLPSDDGLTWGILADGGRLTLVAGRRAGLIVADLTMDAGGLVVDVGKAAARGGQKTAIHTVKAIGWLGRTLSPF